jgi:hypothetical protein
LNSNSLNLLGNFLSDEIKILPLSYNNSINLSKTKSSIPFLPISWVAAKPVHLIKKNFSSSLNGINSLDGVNKLG